ncbi:MAG: T9SS type A sorting domain-containing protein, partial [Bacteroidota bacterium]
GPLAISITNLQGAAVWQKTMPHAPGLMEISLPVGELAAGFYMVTLKEEGRTLTKKLTIE